MSDALEKIVNEKIWKFEHLYIFIIDGSVVSLLIVGPKYDLNKIEIASCHGYSEIFSFSSFERIITWYSKRPVYSTHSKIISPLIVYHHSSKTHTRT
jgi:hypothetical protein